MMHSIAIACFEISFMAFQNTKNFEVTHDGYRVLDDELLIVTNIANSC